MKMDNPFNIIKFRKPDQGGVMVNGTSTGAPDAIGGAANSDNANCNLQFVKKKIEWVHPSGKRSLVVNTTRVKC